MTRRCMAILVLVLVAVVNAAGAGAAASQDAAALFPYRSAAFSVFVHDSYTEVPSGGVTPFYAWFEQAYTKSSALWPGAPGLRDALADRRAALAAATDPASRAQVELNTAVWLHRVIKATIPRFSLARGYEFAYTVTNGERQCLLQSVLLAGLLQSVGVDAGVVMVWKNMHGQESNNGHAVPLVRLSDGRDVEIDPSEPQPIAPHQGLFARDRRRGTYRFVEPVLDHSGFITGYHPAGRTEVLGVREVQPLPAEFLRAQFYYYRGEQIPGGLVNGPATRNGLLAAAHFLERSLHFAPQNPLAVYMLGRVYQRLGNTASAKRQYVAAYDLYVTFGHLFDGPRGTYAEAARM